MSLHTLLGATSLSAELQRITLKEQSNSGDVGAP